MVLILLIMIFYKKCYTLSVNTNFLFFLFYYLQGFIECLCTLLKKLSEIVKTCIEEIAEWRHLQQRSLCGFPCPPSLDKLQEVYVHLNFFIYLFCHTTNIMKTIKNRNSRFNNGEETHKKL